MERDFQMAVEESLYFQELLIALPRITLAQPFKVIGFLVMDVIGHTACIADIRHERQKAEFAKGCISAKIIHKISSGFVKMRTVRQILPSFAFAFSLAKLF